MTEALAEKRDYIEALDAVLALSQQSTDPHVVSVLGKDFVVLPQVFSPGYYAETAFYSELVVDLLKPGQEYLDLGCGVGVTAVMAALKDVRVTALDINPHAVENTILNARRHGVSDRVTVMVSDVYSALETGRAFDALYWNVPFSFREEGTRLTFLEEAFYDPGYRKNRAFILGAKSHVRPGGQILMGVSSTLGNNDAVEAFAYEGGIKFERIAEMVPDAPYEIRIQLLLATV